MKRAHKVRPASLQELETIVEALPDRYKLMALLAAWCALRFGELTELRRGDIDLRTNRVSITRGVVRADGAFVVGSPKSDAGVRDVAIPPHLIPVVKTHLKNHTGKAKDALLFPAAADSNCTELLPDEGKGDDASCAGRGGIGASEAVRRRRLLGGDEG